MNVNELMKPKKDRKRSPGSIVNDFCGFVGLVCFILRNLLEYWNDRKDEYLCKKDDIENWNHGKCRICGAQMVRADYGFNPKNGFRIYECSKNKDCHPPVRIRNYIERFEDFKPINKEKE